MNYSAQKILWLAVIITIVILLAMFIVPILSAVVLVFLGVVGLLMFSKWVVRIFNGGQLPQQDEISHQDTGSSPWAKMPKKLVKLAQLHEEISEGEVVSEKKKEL